MMMMMNLEAWLEALDYGAEGESLESMSSQLVTEKKKTAENGYLSLSGKDKAARGEGRDPPFLCSVQDTVPGLYHPLPVTPAGYGKPLPFTFTYLCRQSSCVSCATICISLVSDGTFPIL